MIEVFQGVGIRKIKKNQFNQAATLLKKSLCIGKVHDFFYLLAVEKFITLEDITHTLIDLKHLWYGMRKCFQIVYTLDIFKTIFLRRKCLLFIEKSLSSIIKA